MITLADHTCFCLGLLLFWCSWPF